MSRSSRSISLSQTVRYVLKVIGYKEIVPYFVAVTAADFVFAFRDCAGSRRRIRAGVFRSFGKTNQRACRAGPIVCTFADLQACVKHLRGAKDWSRTCDRCARKWSALCAKSLPPGRSSSICAAPFAKG